MKEYSQKGGMHSRQSNTAKTKPALNVGSAEHSTNSPTQATTTQKPLKLTKPSKSLQRALVQPKYPVRPLKSITPSPLHPTPGQIPSTKSSYHREFFDAIYGNDIDKVKHLVKVTKVKVNIVDEDDPWRPSPLIAACEYQLVDIVKILLKAKPIANINQRDRKGRLPIWWAAKHGNKELAEVLIYDAKTDCDVNTVDEDSGCAPLYRAILSNAPEVCRLLVHAGADVNLRRLWKVTKQSEVAESPLVKAVQMGSYNICEILVNSLCKINAKTEDGFIALHYAVGYRRYQIAELLLENRAHVNARSRKGVTAMTIAIREQLPAMCRILVEWGYDIDKAFKWNETPLEMALRLHAEGCAMTLVAWGSKIAPDRRLRYYRKYAEPQPPTLFYKAASEGLVKLMKLLIDIYPYFLHEDWMRTKQIPLALYTDMDFCEWLYKENSTPRSLAELCKGSILKYMGKYSCKRIDKLPLPTKLQDYLRVDKHLTDKIYRQLPLEDSDCPYHCPALCPRNPQCPELDFSDSCSD